MCHSASVVVCGTVGAATSSQVHRKTCTDDKLIRGEQFGKSSATVQRAWLLAAMLFVSITSAQLQSSRCFGVSLGLSLKRLACSGKHLDV